MKDKVFQLCDTIREAAYSLHRFLGPGHLEKVYENGLFHRLCKHGLQVRVQFPLAVFDEDGTVLGEYFADLFVESILIIELKAAKSITDEHTAQLLGYLRASQIEHGLLINFGSPTFQIKKFIMSADRYKSVGIEDT